MIYRSRESGIPFSRGWRSYLVNCLFGMWFDGPQPDTLRADPKFMCDILIPHLQYLFGLELRREHCPTRHSGHSVQVQGSMSASLILQATFAFAMVTSFSITGTATHVWIGFAIGRIISFHSFWKDRSLRCTAPISCLIGFAQAAALQICDRI